MRKMKATKRKNDMKDEYRAPTNTSTIGQCVCFQFLRNSVDFLSIHEYMQTTHADIRSGDAVTIVRPMFFAVVVVNDEKNKKK